MGKKMPATIISFDGVSVFPRWYAVVTKYNYEAKLANTIINGAEKAGFGEKIFEVLVPIKETVEFTTNAKGKEVEKKKYEKVYPLYIFVKAIMDDNVWNYIKNSDGSAAILAPSGMPIQVEEEDILKIKIHCGLIEPEYETDFDPEIGQDVYIQNGMFKGKYGKISRVQTNGITVDIEGIPIKMDIKDLELVEFVD